MVRLIKGDKQEIRKRNNRPVQRGRGHSTHPDLQCRTEEQTGGVLQEVPRPLPTGKDLRARRRVLCSGQVPTVHPSAAAVQRGTQTKSKRERQAKRFRQSDGIM